MSSIANAVFNFVQHVIETGGGAIGEALALPSRYHLPDDEAHKRFVRVWDMAGAKPLPDGTGEIILYGGRVPVEFITRPEDLSLDEQTAAREISATMAKEFAKAICADGNDHLGVSDGSICGVLIDRQDDDWRADNVIYPVSFLILIINPMGET